MLVGSALSGQKALKCAYTEVRGEFGNYTDISGSIIQ